jgi:hypothetical protein
MRSCGPESLVAMLNCGWVFLGFLSNRSAEVQFSFENYCLDADRRELKFGAEVGQRQVGFEGPPAGN